MHDRVLLVDDDKELVDVIESVLRDDGYDVDVAHDGQRGLHLALTREYDVLVLDRKLPALEGLDVLTRLRSRGVSTHALMLTGMSALGDRVAGLDAGADDYLAKPFELDELSARVRSLCRRAHATRDGIPVGKGRLVVSERTVELADGASVPLADREFALLRTLAERPDAVRSRATLRGLVFPETGSASIVDTYVYYLRRKLGPQVVRTERGLGYRLGTL